MAESGQYWLNGRGQTAVDVQPGGSGNNWMILDIDASATAPSGGRQGVESAWGRGANGQSEFLLTRFTGNPERWTFDVMARITRVKWLRGLLGDLDERSRCGCVNRTSNVRIRQRCGDQRDILDYTMAWTAIDAASTSSSFDQNLANAAEGDSVEVMEQESLSAAVALRSTKLVHNDISGSVSDVTLNDALHVCDAEWWAVGNADNTPGYLSQPVPKFLYTTDSGANWTAIDIPVFFNGNAIKVLKVGGNAVVLSATNGVAYAPITSLKVGGTTATGAWALSTGFTSPNFPNDMASTNTNVIWAVGNTGRIWKSSDGGLSFVAQTNTGTVENLQSVAVASDDLIWFGGANAALVRGFRGSFSALTVTGLTGTINALAVPDKRPSEVYLGTSTGRIWRTRNSADTVPTWDNRAFVGSGNGQVIDLKFTGLFGNMLYIIQSALDGTSRILRDTSGGALGLDVEIIGDFQSPSNFGFTAIAPANENDALVVGNVHESFAFIGRVAG